MQEVLAVDFFSRCESEMLAGGGTFFLYPTRTRRTAPTLELSSRLCNSLGA